MLNIQQAPYQAGSIYLIGVPIGNIDDISYKAVKLLTKIEYIFAEDTRKAHRLLTDLNIKDKNIMQHHEHNEVTSSKGIIDLAISGNDVALISDAGMPTIADPGFVLTKYALENNINVIPVSGPCAAILGIVGSGLSCASFTFLGFLPRGENQIIKKLNDYKKVKDTIIFYESPKRIIKTLIALEKSLGNRQISLGRELTKTHEEFIRGDVQSAIAQLESRDKVLGEFCVVINGATKEDLIVEDATLEVDIKEMIAQGKTAKDIKNELSVKYNIHKKQVYKVYLELI